MPSLRRLLPLLPLALAGAVAASVLVARPLVARLLADGGDAGSGTRVMPLGDSITDGWNVPGGYRVGLARRLAEAGHAVDFVGSQRDGSPSMPGRRIDEIQAGVRRWLARHEPDVVLLMAGTNDIVQGAGPAEVAERIGALVDTITAARPGARLIVSSALPLGDARDRVVRTYNAAIPGIVAERARQGRPVTFVDAYPVVAHARLVDGIHPDARGYEALAELWFEALAPYVERAGDPPPQGLGAPVRPVAR